MEITIDIDDSVPVFAQLIAQIKAAVQRGDLRPGDPLPSIRQLATDLEVNSKTVAKAYRLLERDSVIEAKGYRGTFIHPDARANSEVDLNELVIETFEKDGRRAQGSGATDSEIRIAFADVMNRRND